MTSNRVQVVEQGIVTLSDEAWTQARRRTEIIGPLAKLELVGHEAVNVFSPNKNVVLLYFIVKSQLPAENSIYQSPHAIL